MPRESGATLFRESVDGVLAELPDLRDDWLDFEEQFDRLCSVSDDIKSIHNTLGHDPLCYNTSAFLWKVKRLSAVCPIDFIERFKLIRAEMETLPLLSQGVWKTETYKRKINHSPTVIAIMSMILHGIEAFNIVAARRDQSLRLSDRAAKVC